MSENWGIFIEKHDYIVRNSLALYSSEYTVYRGFLTNFRKNRNPSKKNHQENM